MAYMGRQKGHLVNRDGRRGLRHHWICHLRSPSFYALYADRISKPKYKPDLIDGLTKGMGS